MHSGWCPQQYSWAECPGLSGRAELQRGCTQRQLASACRPTDRWGFGLGQVCTAVLHMISTICRSLGYCCAGGGLLAGIPAKSAGLLVDILHAAGYLEAAIIGKVLPGPATGQDILLKF